MIRIRPKSEREIAGPRRTVREFSATGPQQSLALAREKVYAGNSHAMKAFDPLCDAMSVLPILGQISILGGVSDEKIGRIFQKMETGSYRKGEHVFQSGDEPTHIYIVKSGVLDLLAEDDGVEILREELRIGECFGEAALMSMQRHTATVLAREPSEVLVLSRHALISLRREDIELFALLMMNIARELARRLKQTDDILLHYMHVKREEAQS